MLKTEKFQQGQFLENYRLATGKASLGICARLTYEWIAAKLRGQTFDYTNVDVKRCESYMAPYTREAFSLLTDPTFTGDTRFGASRYVVTDILKMKEHLNKWGTGAGIQCTEGVRATLSHYVSTRVHRHGAVAATALMVSFYLHCTAKDLKPLEPWIKVSGPLDRPIISGHVLGYSVSDHTFFDSNLGYYTLADSSPALNALEIEKHITTHYSAYGYTNNAYDRGVFQLAKL